jgi:glyoxylase-like metal-dependent hydrolase (beta-lactamase superfamily II)
VNNNYEYSCEPIAPAVWRLKDRLGVAMYLVVGRERAALIDTGYGFTGLRDAVRALTELPVIVLLSHGHVDHAFGIYEFADVPIYLHPLDADTYRMHSDPVYRERFMRNSGLDYCAEDFQPACPIDFQPVEDGQSFDLGGLTIRALHVPGHTKGMIVYLMVEPRIAIFGDACGPNTMIMEDCSGNLSDYRASLLRLKTHEAEYDRVVRNHGSCESPKSLLDVVIDVCGRVLAGTDARQPLPAAMQKMFPTVLADVPPCYSAKEMLRTPGGRPTPADGIEGNINYRADKVR